MAGTAKIWFQANVEIDGAAYQLPLKGREVPTDLTVTGPGVAVDRFSVASATQAIWTGTSFSLLIIVSDRNDVMVELRGALAAGNHHFELVAGLPFILGSDDTLVYNAAAGFAGAADSFTRIDVKNNSGATALIDVLVVA